MSMDLLSSCSNAYSSYSTMMLQYSLAQAEQQRSSWEMGKPSSSGRLIQHRDGTIEVISKTPGEVVGEKVREVVTSKWKFIKQAFSLLNQVPVGLQQGVNLFKKKLAPLDRLFSRAVTLLPVAEAAVPPAAVSTALVPYGQFRRDYTAKDLLQLDTHSYAEYVADLDPKHCVALLNDGEVQSNYNKFIEEINNLVVFMINTSNIFDSFMQETIVEECQRLVDVESFLHHETENLSEIFALPSQNTEERILRLQLPKAIYHNNGTTIVVQNRSFTNRGQSMAIPPNELEFSAICHENPVIDIIKGEFGPHVALLVAMNVDRLTKFTYEQFEALFKNPEIVKNVQEQIKKYKGYLQSRMRDIHFHALNKIRYRVANMVKKIERLVHFIRQKQQARAVEQGWGGWYLYTILDDHGTHDRNLGDNYRSSHRIAWTVKEYQRTWWNKAVFSFELIT